MASATYETIRPFWDGTVLHPAGDIVTYDGKPSPNLRPIDADGIAAAEAAEAERQADELRSQTAAATAQAQQAAIAAAVAEAMAPLLQEIEALKAQVSAPKTKKAQGDAPADQA